MRRDSGLRCQTPMSQTASNPKRAMAAHSPSGTSASAIRRQSRSERCSSQAQVLISYRCGCLRSRRAGNSAFASGIARSSLMVILEDVNCVHPRDGTSRLVRRPTAGQTHELVTQYFRSGPGLLGINPKFRA